MTVTKAHSIAIPSFDKVKMEERKRSLANDVDDLAPRKRQMKDENGQAMRMDAEKEKDVESFQKDAIWRQMREYKREKGLLETQVTELAKKATYHDDHLRTIDAWFAQLLDEIHVLASDALPTPPTSEPLAGEEMYRSALTFSDNNTFEVHLASRSQQIKSVITDIFGRLPSAAPDIRSLQERLATLLAAEKAYIAESRRLAEEKEQLTERLEGASYRYLMAEKKLERTKSAQVQKLEKQAMMGGNGEASSPTTGKAVTPKKEHHAEVNGELENGLASAEAETARKEAIAAADQRKVQLEQLEAENKRLTEDLSSANTKLASLSDDDYASTALFKTFKSQHEDVIKRINDLEATNVQLREEAQKLHAERTSFRSHLEEESRAQINESESQAARTESDLARVRNARDELVAEKAILAGAADERKISLDSFKTNAESKDNRIAALESEVERLKLQIGESTTENMDVDEMDTDALKSKLRTLESQYALLSNELPSMEAAWKKTQALASKKVAELADWEEQRSRLNAEKVKADQKYFAIHKAKDAKELELRSLKQQNAQSSSIISQLKDNEKSMQEKFQGLDKQLAESREMLAKLEQQHRSMQQKVNETTIASEGLKSQIAELKKLVSTKDAATLSAGKDKREAEVELEQLKVRLEDSKSQLDKLKKTRASTSGADSDDWRRLAICPVCNTNLRNTALKLCGHVFCKACVQDLISNRSRKCPSCSKGFGNNDSMPIVLT